MIRQIVQRLTDPMVGLALIGYPDRIVLRRIGGDGRAKVYVCTKTGRYRRFFPWLIKAYGISDTSPAVIRDEARLQAIATSPYSARGIQAWDYVGHQAGHELIATSYCADWQPLSTLLQPQRPPCQPWFVMSFVEDVSAALAELHQTVAHRNLSPRAISMRRGSTGHVSFRVNDFSKAKIVAGKGMELAVDPVGGATGYTAPEQRHALDHGTSVDVYALAKIAYELSMRRVLPAWLFHGRAPSLTAARPDLSPAFADVLLACLDEVPRNRPTAMELSAVSKRERIRAMAALWSPRIDGCLFPLVAVE